MSNLINLTVANDRHMTFVSAEGFGEYCSIPLDYSNSYSPNSVEYVLDKVQNGSGIAWGGMDIAYTYGHEGEEAHEWYVIGYELYERADGMESEIRLQFAPKYPDMFPDETAFTESNMHDCSFPDIYRRILADRGKMPTA